MTNVARSSFFRRIAGLCLGVACFPLSPLPGQDAGVPGRHLFILSGQSNMTAGLVQGFTGKVEEAFGEKNVAVAMSMKSGRGLRFWCSDYRYPDNREPGEQEKTDNGSLYQPLIEAVRVAAADRAFDTVTFIWMQGESDAAKGRADVYAENFLKLLERLKADLRRDDVRFVIGRISDHDMKNEKFRDWTKMREVQVKLAEDHADGAWIDTDDLNGGEGALHYDKDGAGKLGVRFAIRAIEQILEKQNTNPGP